MRKSIERPHVLVVTSGTSSRFPEQRRVAAQLQPVAPQLPGYDDLLNGNNVRGVLVHEH
jgi:hypothetical protein